MNSRIIPQKLSPEIERERFEVFLSLFETRRNEIIAAPFVFRAFKWMQIHMWSSEEAKKEMILKGYDRDPRILYSAIGFQGKESSQEQNAREVEPTGSRIFDQRSASAFMRELGCSKEE